MHVAQPARAGPAMVKTFSRLSHRAQTSRVRRWCEVAPAEVDTGWNKIGLSLHDLPRKGTNNFAVSEAKRENGAKMRLILAIATTGRCDVLSDTICQIARQTRLPDLVAISVASPEDVDPAILETLPCARMIVSGPKGTCAQRNRMLALLAPDDIMLLIDDDFLMAPDYIAQTIAVFESNPDVVIATGTVLADGIGGPGFGLQEGLTQLGDAHGKAGAPLHETYNGYGCNMAFRARPVVEGNMRFDERLPLYGWLEDVDFSRSLAPHGRIVRSDALLGVHLGTKLGRTTGTRLGYSQVANPIYLIGKGRMHPRLAIWHVMKNIGANLRHSLRPEPWVDRRGRLKGNFIALGDLLRGRMAPERVLSL